MNKWIHLKKQLAGLACVCLFVTAVMSNVAIGAEESQQPLTSTPTPTGTPCVSLSLSELQVIPNSLSNWISSSEQCVNLIPTCYDYHFKCFCEANKIEVKFVRKNPEDTVWINNVVITGSAVTLNTKELYGSINIKVGTDGVEDTITTYHVTYEDFHQDGVPLSNTDGSEYIACYHCYSVLYGRITWSAENETYHKRNYFGCMQQEKHKWDNGVETERYSSGNGGVVVIKYTCTECGYSYTTTLCYDNFPKSGDVDLNGSIDLDDANTTLKAALNITTLEGDALTAADVDHDNSITLNDAQTILKIALGIY